MSASGSSILNWRRASLPFQGRLGFFGFILGVAMPIVSALIYPTYMHKMQNPALEFSRLLEMPFVALELGVIFWAHRSGMDRRAMWAALPRDIKAASMVFLVGVFASSIFISQNPTFSITMSLITVIHLLFSLAVLHLLSDRNKVGNESQFLPLLGVGLGIFTLYTAWWFSFPPPESEVFGGKIEWSSAVPGFISVRHFGAWAGVIAAAFAVRILYQQGQHSLGWDHALYFLAAAMTIWSGTRAAVLGIIFAVIAVALIKRTLPNFRNIVLAALLTGLGAVFAFVLLPHDPAFYLWQTGDAASLNKMGGNRPALWAATFTRWLDSPILGWGSGSTFWEVFVNWPHTQPHNVVLQFLISWGIVGAAGGMWLLGRAIVAVHRSVIAQPEQLALLAMLDALLVQSLLEGMLHYPRFIIAIILLFAMILTPSRCKQTQVFHAD